MKTQSLWPWTHLFFVASHKSWIISRSVEARDLYSHLRDTFNPFRKDLLLSRVIDFPSFIRNQIPIGFLLDFMLLFCTWLQLTHILSLYLIKYSKHGIFAILFLTPTTHSSSFFWLPSEDCASRSSINFADFACSRKVSCVKKVEVGRKW